MAGRKAILEHYVESIIVAEDTDLAVIARGTPGLTGADLENVVVSLEIQARTLEEGIADPLTGGRSESSGDPGEQARRLSCQIGASRVGERQVRVLRSFIKASDANGIRA